MGSYKWGHKPLGMGYNYGYPTYNPTYNYPDVMPHASSRFMGSYKWGHNVGFL